MTKNLFYLLFLGIVLYSSAKTTSNSFEKNKHTLVKTNNDTPNLSIEESTIPYSKNLISSNIKEELHVSNHTLANFSIAGEFITRWNTTNISSGSSADNEITIPTNSAYIYNYTIDWGDGSTDSNVAGDITHTYSTQGSYTIMISGDFPAIYFNDAGDRLKIIEILDWGTIQWQSMENAFYGCENLNFDAINSPDLSQVTTLKNMFKNGLLFNGIINSWDVSTITDISGMFHNARVFNRPLDTWVTSSMTDMSFTFFNAVQFNEPLDSWITGSVTSMARMFNNAMAFNQNINNWNVSQVTDMTGTFSDTNSFNNPLNNWNVSKVTDMSYMFHDSAFNLPIGNWNVAKVTSMANMFSNAEFNQPIDSWNVALVEDMSYMFQRHRTFNQTLNSWNVGNVTNMSSMFDGYYWNNVFNQPLSNWDVSKVTNMANMFRDNSTFNQAIGGWNVSEVTNMTSMFSLTDSFNQDISSWNVANVTLMTNMFQRSAAFNQPLNNWVVTGVTNMSYMFQLALVFNQPLNNWNVSGVTNMSFMFDRAATFNQPVNNWVVDQVINMSGMYQSATAFNQNLATWNITAVTNMATMLSYSGLSQENYDNTLIGWAAQAVSSNINLGAHNLNYCDGLAARQQLIDTNNWAINNDIVNCSYVLCTDIISPYNGDQNVPANSSIRWNAAPNATGYRISIRREDDTGNVLQVIYDNEDIGDVLLVYFTNEFFVGDNVFVTVVPYNAEGPATGCQEISFKTVASWVNSLDAFKLTYDSRIQYSSNTTPANQLKIQTRSGLIYDYSIDWGDGQYDNHVPGEITHTYLNQGIYTVSIIGEFPAPRHQESSSDAHKLLSIDQWGTQPWKSMEGAFDGCVNMEYNASDIPDLSSVTDMSKMFLVCSKFDGNINAWDVSNVTNMYALFGVARLFNQPLNNWNVSAVTDMSLMFFRTDAFNQNINNWNTSNVTNMYRMFEDADAFDQPINDWNVSSVENMKQMFQRAEVFNQPLNNWNVSAVTDMEDMFNNTPVFNQNIDSWNVSAVTTMESMFSLATAFNQPLDSWNVSAVTTMESMFSSAPAFNQPLDSWNVSAVTNMSNMFRYADSFNQPLNSWNVETVTTMSSMFLSATVFNQPLQNWNVSRVVSMQSMFYSAETFNQPLQNWNVNSVVNMSSMFRSAESFNQPLNSWNVSAVANMSLMFHSALLFNQPIENWNVSSVTLTNSMFENAEAFNQPINNWDMASVTTMENMFKDAILFNQPLENWDTGEVLTMEEMFMGASAFNNPIASWDVSFVTTMEAMFENAITFNQPLNSWNVASVLTMKAMFKDATLFNGDVDAWNVRGVTTMERMFSGASSFNQSINNWRVSAVDNMNYMFYNASAYNQAMDLWNLGNPSMRATFYNATSLNQYLGDWDISGVTNMTDMLDNTILTRENYDNTLIAWSEQTPTTGITLGAEGLPYCDALEERQSMIDTYGWSFSADVLDCPIPVCTQITSPLNGEIDVPVNTNLTWEPATFARGYRLTVRKNPGNVVVVNDETVNDTSYEFASDFNTGDIVFITLIPFNDEGDAVGPCIEESFTISSDPATIPDCTNLTEPLLGANDVLITSDLSWNPISNADGYKLTVGTTPGGNDILNAEDVGNVVTYDLATNLPEDSDIYVTITPYNDEGDATGCTEENFNTELIPVPPVCTNLTSPLNNATAVFVDTSLSWTAVSNATGYLVIVGTTSGGIEIVNNIDVGDVTSYDIPQDLQESRLYYVTIIPYNAEGDATGCTEETFTTGNSTSPPSCSTLSTPLNDATKVALNTNLSWNGSGSVTGYRLTVGTTSNGTDIFTGDIGDVTTYDFASDLPESTLIYVSIIAYNDNGDATGCTEESFMTDGLPACTSLSSPINGATNIAIDTDISWNAIADVEGYKLTVTASTSTVNNLTDFIVSSGTSYSFANDFEPEETVTITIIPYNEIGDAIGCTTENFTIQSTSNCTSLISPSNGAVNVPVNTNLEWAAVADANGYKLTVLASSTTANNSTDLVLTTGTSYNFATDFEPGETVTVTIAPYNDAGDTVGCISESFTIKTIPSCTNLSAPFNGEVIPEVNEIIWNAVENADGYKLSISGSNSTANNITDLIVTETTYILPNGFNQGETITVNITPYNGIGDALGCSSENFTIRPLPSCATINAPLNGATEVAINTDIIWNASTDADGYYISVGTSPNGTDIVNREDVASLTNYTFAEDLPSETLIYVNIIPYNTSGDALGCLYEGFKTDISIPNCASLLSPSNGDTDISLTAIISWDEIETAGGYRISIGTTTNGNDIVNNQDMGTSTSYTHNSDFPFGTQIYVAIIPYNSKGDAVQCEEQSFTTLIPEDATKYGFSPDGDGINEYWHIENIDYYPENVVTIYNRWGDAVFRINNYDNSTNAFRGEANLKTKMGAGRLPEGTYFFNIQIEGEVMLHKTKGYLVIKR